jgi:hypothetical protein
LGPPPRVQGRHDAASVNARERIPTVCPAPAFRVSWDKRLTAQQIVSQPVLYSVCKDVRPQGPHDGKPGPSCEGPGMLFLLLPLIFVLYPIKYQSAPHSSNRNLTSRAKLPIGKAML